MFSPAILNKFKDWKNSPLQFVNDVIDVTPSEQQIDYLKKVAHSKRVTIRSGHGTGKDASTSWVIMWFMCTRAFAKVACTAPTARQLSDILWSELSKWFRKSKVADEFVIQKDKIFQKDNPKEWWCRAISVSAKASKEEQAETLAGLHGDHLLIVVDEASGVNDPVYIPLEGALTQEDNKVVLIGNMTRNSGYFYESHFHASINKNWEKLHWDSRKSSNVSDEYVKYMLNKYGEESNVFRIRVAGDPPLDDERTFIPLAWAQQCVGLEIEADEEDPLYLSVDVARYGEDKSIVMPRRGMIISPWEEHQKMSTADLGSHILADFREMEADGIAIDEIGVGAGTLDWLRKIPDARKFAFGVNVANASSDKMRWHRLRDELWWRTRENCQKGAYSFPCATKAQEVMSQELCNELSCLLYDYDNNGAYQIESKKQAKLRGVASPNIADALVISEYFNSYAHKVFMTKGKAEAIKRKKEKEKENAMLAGVSDNSQAWMAM
jgi:phage terminase large subunit